jgi:hypothetical protein
MCLHYIGVPEEPTGTKMKQAYLSYILHKSLNWVEDEAWMDRYAGR